MAKTGQTRTHALLAYAFGIRSVVVAVTQLDNLVVPYSRKRYDWCQSEVIRYLKRVGFVQDRVTCLPVSGLCGDNIVEPSKNLPWYEIHAINHTTYNVVGLQARQDCVLPSPFLKSLQGVAVPSMSRPHSRCSS